MTSLTKKLAPRTTKICQHLLHVNICCYSFIKILKKKNCDARYFDVTVNFNQIINIDFCWPNNFGIAYGISVKFGFQTLHKLKILTLFTFGCPLHNNTTEPGIKRCTCYTLESSCDREYPKRMRLSMHCKPVCGRLKNSTLTQLHVFHK